jgi:hypothetical protein
MQRAISMKSLKKTYTEHSQESVVKNKKITTLRGGQGNATDINQCDSQMRRQRSLAWLQ